MNTVTLAVTSVTLSVTVVIYGSHFISLTKIISMTERLSRVVICETKVDWMVYNIAAS